MKLTHLAFDMDGVIYSAEGFIADAYRDAIKQSGLDLPLPSTSQIMEQIGKPIWEIYRNLFPGITKEEMMEFRTHTRRNVVQMVAQRRGKIYEGIPMLIKELSDKFTLAACSNGGGNYIETILTTYSLRQYFIPILTLDSEKLSNKSELLHSYISKNGNNSSAWAMIGDRKTDFEAAKNNNCLFIGCTWGHADPNELDGSDIIVHTPTQILTALGQFR